MTSCRCPSKASAPSPTPSKAPARKRRFYSRRGGGEDREEDWRGRGNLSRESFCPSKLLSSHLPKTVKIARQIGGLKRGFCCSSTANYSSLSYLNLLSFFLISYVDTYFPFSYSYRAHKITSGSKTLSCYFTNFSKESRDFNSTFPFQIAYYLRYTILVRNRQHMYMIRT